MVVVNAGEIVSLQGLRWCGEEAYPPQKSLVKSREMKPRMRTGLAGCSKIPGQRVDGPGILQAKFRCGFRTEGLWLSVWFPVDTLGELVA